MIMFLVGGVGLLFVLGFGWWYLLLNGFGLGELGVECVRGIV